MSFETVNPTTARELLQSRDRYVYVDVRTVEEFTDGHVPGSYNVPVLFRGPMGMEPNAAFESTIEQHFEKDQPLILGCKAGGRSHHACEILSRMGFTNLVNMHGGFHGATDPSGEVTEPGWAACGFETTVEADPAHTWEGLQRG